MSTQVIENVRIPEWQKVGKQSRDDSYISIQHHFLSGKREKIY